MTKPAPSAAALTEQIAGLLADHRVKHDSTGGYRGILGGHNVACKCGWHGVDHGERPDVFDAHVAAEVAARLADSRPVVSEAAITEVLLRHREAQWSDGRSGCSPCGNHAEVTTREEAQAAQAIGHMDSYTDYCSHIAAALTAALPHMGDGRGEAEVIAEALEAWADELDKPPYDLWDRAAIPRLRARAASLRLSPTGDDSE